MKKYLFVGGKADGHMISVCENYWYWNISYIDGILDIPTEEQEMLYCQSSIKQEVYRKIQWQSGDKTILEFFALNSMDNHVVMDTVLNNYKPKQEVELDNRIKGMKILLEECASLFKDILDYPHASSLNRRIWDITLKIFKFININKL